MDVINEQKSVIIVDDCRQKIQIDSFANPRRGHVCPPRSELVKYGKNDLDLRLAKVKIQFLK